MNENILEFEVIDLNEIKGGLVDFEPFHDGCGWAFGRCSAGAGCGYLFGNCRIQDETAPVE